MMYARDILVMTIAAIGSAAMIQAADAAGIQEAQFIRQTTTKEMMGTKHLKTKRSVKPGSKRTGNAANKCEVARHDAFLMNDAKSRFHCTFSKAANDYMHLVASYAKRSCGLESNKKIPNSIVKENDARYGRTLYFQGKSKAHRVFCDGFDDYPERSYLFK